jgi:arabinose-5-phosphate isomerase
VISIGRDVMRKEAAAIAAAAERLGPGFEQAVAVLAAPGCGKVMVLGVGKSGRVGEKIAGTLRSTGTPAIFLHAAELAHGDLGIYSPGDPTILISKSGATAELVKAVPYLRERQSPLIGILGNMGSPLAGLVDIALDANVRAEAEPYNLAPTASSAVALALGDALAIAVMQAKGITAEQFAWNHPDGQLGRNTRLTVAEAMHEAAVTVSPQDTLREVIVTLTKHPLGAVCVANADGSLAGLITDGDLRRALFAHPLESAMATLLAADIMTARPVLCTESATLQDALTLMEDRPSQISVLPVVDAANRIRGILRLHDVYQSLLP